jgi:hypothetical protein
MKIVTSHNVVFDEEGT